MPGVRLFPLAGEELPDRDRIGLLLATEGSAMFEGWSDRGRWRIILPWPDELRSLTWEEMEHWELALRQITDSTVRPSDPSCERVPFTGGWVGYAGYDAGASSRGAAPYDERTPEPPFWFARHERGIVIEPSGRAFLFCEEGELAPSRTDLASMVASLHEEIASIGAVPIIESLDANEYRAAVEEIRGAIRRGDLYQVNLTRRFTAPGRWDAYAMYLALTGDDVPRCSAFINGGTWQIASASPELFLSYDAATGVAESRPIKGTIERTGKDRADTEWLLSSRKDASEHLMIVDLIRNDFGKVAPAGRVGVPSFRDVIKLKHVLHLESTVRAEGLGDRPFSGVFASMFPSGSITGAPKRAVVQCIRRLEPVPRGVYTGAIGYWDFRGRSEWSVAIRTAVIAPDHARYHAGGGVVWDSTPEAEERESIAKATAFLGHCGTTR